MSNPGNQNEHWHVDKSVPVTFIASFTCGILFQTAIIIWFISALSTRVESLEQSRIMLAPIGERVTRVETKQDMMMEMIKEIRAIVGK